MLNYGRDYPFPQVFDGTWVKKAIYSDNVVCVVLEEERRVVGTGAVLLDYGDYNDQLGMIKLNVAYEPGEMKLTDKATEIVRIVERAFRMN